MARYLIVLLILRAVSAQSFIPATLGTTPRLLPEDAAVLESRETRADLGCTVKPTVPRLGFDMRFHSGYEVSVPLAELIGHGNRLTTLFRVTPEEPRGDPAYFVQYWGVPAIPAETKGLADLRGGIALGPGKYRVEWLLRDQSNRVCASHWQIAVNPRGRDKQVPFQNIMGTMQSEEVDDFMAEMPATKQAGEGLKILVLFHAAARSLSSASLDRTELQALLGVLRRMAQEPRIASYSLVAFNLDQAAVIYRGEELPQIDFPGLGEALKQVKLGTVDIQKLKDRDGGAEFLSGLLSGELSSRRPDALIFVGARSADSPPLGHSLKEMAEPGFPVFYVDYTPDVAKDPWRDTIGSLVKQWKGSEYLFAQPSDLAAAWNDIIARLTVRSPPRPEPNAATALTGATSQK